MSPPDGQRLLFLAPQFHGVHGGIQAAGKLAWEGVVARSTEHGAGSKEQNTEDRGRKSEISKREIGGWRLEEQGASSKGQTGKGKEPRAKGHKRDIDYGFEHAYLFCYENGAHGLAVDDRFPDGIYAASKLQAVLAAARWRRSVGLVLVWHIGLLKLLPFFRLPDATVVLFLHGIEAWKPQGWITRKVLTRVSLFLTNSDYTWQRFLSFNPGLVNVPHLTVPLGVGSPGTAPMSIPHNPPAVLMISRLARSEDYKGHREMINAWPLVLERVPEAELWIAGDGDLKPELERLVEEKRLQRSVRFWGRVSEEKKQELISESRCLAMPSRGEGFGLVYLEAMRMGRPCLVGTMDAGREVVNPPEAGLAANPHDPHELAGSVCRLISHGPEWERWSAQARRRYEQYFTAGHFQERLIQALTGVGIQSNRRDPDPTHA
jgi:phosphatidyl-myo-inositol dimannoside synthase